MFRTWEIFYDVSKNFKVIFKDVRNNLETFNVEFRGRVFISSSAERTSSDEL